MDYAQFVYLVTTLAHQEHVLRTVCFLAPLVKMASLQCVFHVSVEVYSAIIHVCKMSSHVMRTTVAVIADKVITISWLVQIAFNVITYQTASNVVPQIVKLVAFAKLDTM